MKKLIILMFAALLVFAFTVPAGAVEHQFGGYWRTRFFMQSNFHGYDASVTGSGTGQDVSQIDTRTRLYYTAVINDNLKLVNKFEMDATWGAQDPSTGVGNYGDVGADGVRIEVKNSYAEFNWANGIWRVGVMPWMLSRGLMTDDDAAGVLFMYPWGDHLFGAGYVKIYEGFGGEDLAWDQDVDMPAIFGVFKLADGMTINPYFVYGMSDNGGDDWWASYFNNLAISKNWMGGDNGSVDAFWLGCDFDWNTDQFGLWFSGIYLFGEMHKGFTGFLDLATGVNTIAASDTDWDLGGYLVAIGGHWNLGAGDIHGQAFYASGDGDPSDNDWEQFDVFDGRSYYWSEIMGSGLFDNQNPAANQIPPFTDGTTLSNIYAANLGVTWTFVEKHKFTVDLWYASRVEVDVPPLANYYPDEELGVELDLRYTYPIVENLNLDIVGAYLWAGDGQYKQGPGATGIAPGGVAIPGNPSTENPYELGMQLSLSF